MQGNQDKPKHARVQSILSGFESEVSAPVSTNEVQLSLVGDEDEVDDQLEDTRLPIMKSHTHNFNVNQLDPLKSLKRTQT